MFQGRSVTSARLAAKAVQRATSSIDVSVVATTRRPALRKSSRRKVDPSQVPSRMCAMDTAASGKGASGRPSTVARQENDRGPRKKGVWMRPRGRGAAGRAARRGGGGGRGG